MNTLRFSPHAVRACDTRSIPVDAVRKVLEYKLANIRERSDYAVHVGRTPDRGSLVGSNGTEVWAIVRGGDTVTTVMLRRVDQPSTARALDVDGVIC